MDDIGGLPGLAKDDEVRISEVKEHVPFRQLGSPVPERSTFRQIAEGCKEPLLSLVCH
jgi:hypothetical protein